MQTAINVGWLLSVQNWMPSQDRWLHAIRECYEIIDLLLNSIILKLTLSFKKYFPIYKISVDTKVKNLQWNMMHVKLFSKMF